MSRQKYIGIYSLRLFCKAEPRRALRLVKDGVDTLEEDVTEDVKPDARVSLNPAETRRAGAVDGCVVEVGAGDDESLAADGHVKVGQGGAARVGVAALRRVVRRARDLLVIGGGDVAGQVEEGGASVGDGGADAARGGVAA